MPAVDNLQKNKIKYFTLQTISQSSEGEKGGRGGDGGEAELLPQSTEVQ